MEFFLLSTNFSNTPYITVTSLSYIEQAVGRSPTDLQHLCCKAINKNFKSDR